MRLIWACSILPFVGKKRELKDIFLNLFLHVSLSIDFFLKTNLTTEKDTNVRINVLVFGQNICCILLDKYTLGKGNKW